MTKVIVASFKDVKKAKEAFRKLNELESNGDISLYDQIMLRKKENGEYETLKENTDDDWTVLGVMAVGGLLGTLGGPIGFIIGLYAGAAIGAIAEINQYDFEEDFISKIEKQMPTGTISIIAEIDEDDNDFVDMYLNPFGAVILKSNVDFEYDNYMSEQIDEIEDEISEQRTQLKKSIGKEKTIIEKKIAALKEQRRLKMAEFDAAAKKTVEIVQAKSVSGMGKVTAEVDTIGRKLDDLVQDGKTDRIKRVIARHEAKLKQLQSELELMEQ
jgi:uncharacterized membrane protein